MKYAIVMIEVHDIS